VAATAIDKNAVAIRNARGLSCNGLMRLSPVYI